MASDNSDVIQVKPEDLYDQSEGALAGAPVTHVDGVQEVEPNEKQKHVLGHEQEAQKQSRPVTHETDSIKTTYEEEEGAPKSSLKYRVKGQIEKLGDKLRPKDAVEGKNADPHPGVM